MPKRKISKVVIACALSMLCFPVHTDIWLLGFPLPYCVFERSRSSASFLPFVAPISVLLVLVHVVTNLHLIEFIFRRLRWYCGRQG